MRAAGEKPIRATGGCLCGSVRYRVHGPLRDVWGCHCVFCRRLHSHFAACAACDPADLEVTGTAKLRWYRSSPTARRSFCTKCGAQMFWEPTHKAHISIAAGTINEPTGLRLTRHVCTAQKGDYYEITDGLPQDVGDRE